MQLWTWQLWASEWSPRPPWSELCSNFLSLEPLFKEVKDLVIFFLNPTEDSIILTMNDVVWFHIRSGKCLLIHLHLLACPDVGTCVFHSIFPLLPSRGCREGLGGRTAAWLQHVEKALVHGGWCCDWDPEHADRAVLVRGAQWSVGSLLPGFNHTYHGH